MHRLTRRQARRIAVRAQLLDAPRPTDLLDTVRHLGVVQVDLTAAVAPSAELVCWSRLGSAYPRGTLDDLVAAGVLVDLRGLVRPADDIALLRADMRDWPGRPPLRPWQVEVAGWVEANAACRRDILERLRADGPLPARALPDTTVVPWRSSGWTNSRNVLRLLDFLELRGEVAVASREGRERQWDLAERLHPDGDTVPAEQATRIRAVRRLRSLGVARARLPEVPGEPLCVGDAGEAAVVEGVPGEWRVDPDQLDRPFRGRAALLSPLDRLVVDRRRLAELFEYDYLLEMYKPAAQRRWGYWAMPILYGDRLVGKLDATADPRAGVLRVEAVHEDRPFSATTRAAVDREIRGLARWLGLEVDRG